jgi:hypothetical protein
MRLPRRFATFVAGLLLVLLALPGGVRAQASTFTAQRLDQLLAPVALYPDALLTQVLMAATYPTQVSAAAAWSRSHPAEQGDAAVAKVAGMGWEPSVQSLVAFPQVLATMSQQPAWVQEVGDAFLAQPTDVMESVQRLRRSAQSAGMLKTNEQQTVVVQNPTPQQAVIVIQPTQPQTIYVPAYNPQVVYGQWPYPSSPPTYLPPPPGYAYGNALLRGIAFGTGLAVVNSLWGGWDWGRNDVNINVNRYNHVHAHRRIDANQVNFHHDPRARQGVPYRDPRVKQKYTKDVPGVSTREAYRGRDADDLRRDAARPGADRQPQRPLGDSPGKDVGRPDKAKPTARPAPATRESALGGSGRNDTRAVDERGRASRDATRPAAKPPKMNQPTARPAVQADAAPKPRPAKPAAKEGGARGGKAGSNAKDGGGR